MTKIKILSLVALLSVIDIAFSEEIASYQEALSLARDTAKIICKNYDDIVSFESEGIVLDLGASAGVDIARIRKIFGFEGEVKLNGEYKFQREENSVFSPGSVKDPTVLFQQQNRCAEKFAEYFFEKYEASKRKQEKLISLETQLNQCHSSIQCENQALANIDFNCSSNIDNRFECKVRERKARRASINNCWNSSQSNIFALKKQCKEYEAEKMELLANS